MAKTYLNPGSLFPSLQYGFSQIVTSPLGRLVFIPGQVAWNDKKEIVGASDLGTQMYQALYNVEIAVTAAGGALRDVVSLRIYIVHSHMSEGQAIREALKEFFPPGSAPATTWIGVQSLANPDFLVEIEPIAVIE